MIQVVGLALLADTVGESGVGSIMGLQAVAEFAGSILGPPLGGLVFDLAGHYAVFGMAFVLLIPDLILRLVLKETTQEPKRWQGSEQSAYGTFEDAASDEEGRVRERLFDEDYSPDTENCSVSSCGVKDPTKESQEQQTSLLAGLSLLSNSRLLAALWAALLSAVMLTAVETVSPCFLFSNLFPRAA